MKWFGLTGGIATGKSTVAELLRKSGYIVVDADQIAREVVAPQTEGFQKIVKAFGRTIVQGDGTLNRKLLAKIIFDSQEKRLLLEGITHPLIQACVAEIRKTLEAQGKEIAFYDVPLLFEKNLQPQFDATVVVACTAPKQLERLMQRDGLTKQAAVERIASQMPIDKKTGLADYIIWNDGNLQDLEFQFKEFLKKLNA